MNFRAALDREKSRLESLLDEGISIKRIDGRHYSYKQIREDGKIKSKYIGVADPSQVGIRKRLRLIAWLLKNRDKFIDGLKLLQELNK